MRQQLEAILLEGWNTASEAALASGEEDALEQWLRVSRTHLDELNADRDPRCRLMSFDLALNAAIVEPPDIADRRAALAAGWLGRDLAANRDLNARYGLIRIQVTPASRLLSDVLQSAGGNSLHHVAIWGTNREIQDQLNTLAQGDHRWLHGLDVAAVDGEIEIASSVIDRLIAAAPSLRVLQVSGHRVFDDFPHPSLRKLTVDGFDSVGSLCGSGRPFLKVIELDFAFQGCGRIVDPTTAELGRALSDANLPSLRRLDLARNEPGPLGPNHQGGGVPLYRFIRSCHVLRQLTHLRLPALRTHEDVAGLQAALAEMPALVALVVARDFTGVAKLVHATARIEIGNA